MLNRGCRSFREPCPQGSRNHGQSKMMRRIAWQPASDYAKASEYRQHGHGSEGAGSTQKPIPTNTPIPARQPNCGGQWANRHTFLEDHLLRIGTNSGHDALRHVRRIGTDRIERDLRHPVHSMTVTSISSAEATQTSECVRNPPQPVKASFQADLCASLGHPNAQRHDEECREAGAYEALVLRFARSMLGLKALSHSFTWPVGFSLVLIWPSLGARLCPLVAGDERCRHQLRSELGA